MAQTPNHSQRRLIEAATARRNQAVLRLILMAIVAVSSGVLIGWQHALGWYAIYLCTQVIERVVFEDLISNPHKAPDLAQQIKGYGSFFLTGCVYAYLAIPLWQKGWVEGGMCAILLMASAVQNVVLYTRGNRLTFAISMTPFVGQIILTPLLLYTFSTPPEIILAALGCSFVFLASAIYLWRAVEALHQKEVALLDEAQRRQTEAEAHLAARAALVSTLSHDLRTPLTAITAAARDMDLKPSPDSAHRNAALILEASDMMTGLLNDLLDHARIEAGRLSIDPVPLDLREILNQTARLWAPQARAKGLHLKIEGARHVPQWVMGDGLRLKQILNNLISNALKFTQTGTVGLNLMAWPSETDGTYMTLQVVDTGPGMDQDQLKRLFTPFDQTTDGVAARHGGSGLGLSIAKQLSTLMGGQLTCSSQVGLGTTFTLSLHFEKAIAPPMDLAAQDDTDARPALSLLDSLDRPLRVLAVDDHPINQKAMALILSALEVDLTLADSGEEALRLLTTKAFDVLLIDQNMPGLTGTETVLLLRKAGGPNQFTPAIAVSGDGPDLARADLFDAIVPKPLVPADLMGALSQLPCPQQSQGADPAQSRGQTPLPEGSPQPKKNPKGHRSAA